jgi:hypothetical protein
MSRCEKRLREFLSLSSLGFNWRNKIFCNTFFGDKMKLIAFKNGAGVKDTDDKICQNERKLKIC